MKSNVMPYGQAARTYKKGVLSKYVFSRHRKRTRLIEIGYIATNENGVQAFAETFGGVGYGKRILSSGCVYRVTQ